MASKNNDDSSLEGFIPFNIPVPWDRLKDVTENELGETEELKSKSLQQLRQLIEDSRVKCITRDDFLLRFLRTKKYDVQQSFKALQNYAHQRAAFHDSIMKLEPHTVRTVLSKNIYSIFPYRDKEGRLILSFYSGIWDPDVCSMEDVVMTIIILVNYASESESSQITGLMVFLEMTLIRLNHTYMMLAYAPMLKNCLFFQLHGKTRANLFKDIPSTILANDFGGNLGPLNNEHLIDEIENYLEKMKDEQRHFL